jgi:hypothetical protein
MLIGQNVVQFGRVRLISILIVDGLLTSAMYLCQVIVSIINAGIAKAASVRGALEW